MAQATVVALLSALAVAACGWVFRVLLGRRIALSNPDWRVYEQLYTGVLGGAMADVYVHQRWRPCHG